MKTNKTSASALLIVALFTGLALTTTASAADVAFRGGDCTGQYNESMHGSIRTCHGVWESDDGGTCIGYTYEDKYGRRCDGVEVPPLIFGAQSASTSQFRGLQDWCYGKYVTTPTGAECYGYHASNDGTICVGYWEEVNGRERCTGFIVPPGGSAA